MAQEGFSEEAVIRLFEQYVNSGKVAMYQQMGLDMAPGRREGRSCSKRGLVKRIARGPGEAG